MTIIGSGTSPTNPNDADILVGQRSAIGGYIFLGRVCLTVNSKAVVQPRVKLQAILIYNMGSPTVGSDNKQYCLLF